MFPFRLCSFSTSFWEVSLIWWQFDRRPNLFDLDTSRRAGRTIGRYMPQLNQVGLGFRTNLYDQ
jgi:hypothetical protein